MFKEYDFTPKKLSGRILILGVLTVLILLGTHSSIFSLAAFVISALVVIFDKSHFICHSEYLIISA